MSVEICFYPDWIDNSAMEKVLSAGPSPHAAQYSRIEFRFPVGCKIMIDASVRLLSLFNQLYFCSRNVRLVFEEVGYGSTMGYLNRMGFFDYLEPGIEVLPGRPDISGKEIHGGTNASLVEIVRINCEERDDDLPTTLTKALMQSCGGRPDAKELDGAAWTIFAELIDNIFSHSDTPIDGYAALQLYPRGHRLRVAVSDSGVGILKTLRPALKQEFPALVDLSDIDLLVEIFRQGISRHGADRGCGLKGSAAKAMKFRAQLDVRLPTSRLNFIPGQDGYQPNTAYCYDQLPLIWGTHICFTFSLDG